MGKRSNRIVIILGFAVTLTMAGLSLSGVSFLDGTERILYDSFARFIHPVERDTHRIILVEADGEDPFYQSRNAISELVGLLDEGGSDLIALLMPFPGREKSPVLQEIRTLREKFEVISHRSNDEGLKAWVRENIARMEKLLDGDKRLLDRVRQSGKVVLAIYEAPHPMGESSSEGEFPPELYKNSLTRGHISSSDLLEHAARALLLPYPELAKAALGLGHAKAPGPRLHGRMTHPLFIDCKGTLIPSVPLRLAMVLAGKQPNQVYAGSGGVRMGERTIPALNGEMLFKNFPEHNGFRRVSAKDVLDGKGTENLFKGKVVLVGMAGAPGSLMGRDDLSRMTALLMTAHSLNAILYGDCLSRPTWTPYVEIFLLLIAGIFCALYFPGTGKWGKASWMGIWLGGPLLAGLLLFAFGNMWLRSIYIVATVFSVYLISSLAGRIISGGARKGDSVETNRLLGLSFQSQGLLDLAFEKFKKLPLDLETKDLIYNLARAFEQKRQPDKALAAYSYIAKGGDFRDVSERMAKLEEGDQSSTIGSHEGLTETSVLAESGIESPGRIGRYEIIGELGKGAMGLVYKALDPKINRLLAIKTIRFSDEFDEDVIHEIKERFFREAEIAGRLSHPSIVTIYDVGEEGDLTYMVMEYLEGEDLEKYIERSTLLPFRKVLDVVARVAEALEFAHRAEVIHRDIKPANIMLLKNGGVKVTDFGIAKAISSSRTKTGVILGTPNYMSPEQIMGQKIDYRSDIFSLGVLFFQLLTGKTPFHGDNLSSLLYQITQVKHPSVREYNPRIPRVCDQILDRALAKDPKERFSGAGEMAKYLRLILARIDQLSRKKRA
ncbi:MAG: protein kinase [Deltaproteobacteria bacterium]|nr:protein kinase [Deltaproteobacteria bacterium]MBW2128137.1 protein kinase [Deltaproteobacteria bacterium]